MDDLISDFVVEAAERLAGLQGGLARLANGPNPSAAAEMARRLHGLKGVCGFVGFSRAETLSHAAEGVFAALAQTDLRPASTDLASGADALARLGEILAYAGEHRREPPACDAELIGALDAAAVRLGGPSLIARSGASVALLPTPAEPMQFAADRRARAPWIGLDTFARSLGDRLGKRIDLVVGGDNLQFAQEATPALRTALIALVRNACDHGVETPSERRSAGKSPQGVLHLTVRRTANGAAIDLVDDGRGVDPAQLRARFPQADGLDDLAVQAMVFTPGVSTAEAVTTLSGRGLGLELVRREIEALGGAVELSSVPRRGCRFSVHLPQSAVALPVSRRAAAA